MAVGKGVELENMGPFQLRIFIIYNEVDASLLGAVGEVFSWAGPHVFKANPAPLVAEADAALLL